ncbi:MAG: histidine phosphatase family protein, partial [Clostridia bacterium]|nr:histidine phosphatase family protein [Clostridia bacterium]
MKSYVIHFIRHGMTQANLNGQYAGSWDVPLCEKGKEKLKEIKERYDYPYVEEIYTSPLSRCKDTCGIIYNNSIPIVVEGFKECSFGDWEGKTTEELTSNPDYLNWIKGGGEVKPPNGESWKMFFERVCKSFENVVLSLMKRGVTTAAIFTHGGVIMTILS